MPGIDVRFPHPALCLVEYPTGFQVGDFRQMLADLKMTNARGNRFAVLVDMRKSNPRLASANHRREASMVMKEQATFFRDEVVCAARIVNSVIVRGMITVFDALSLAPWPQRTFGRPDVAEDWVLSQLRKADVEAPKSRVFKPPSANVA
jgi:hypothetical protein